MADQTHKQLAHELANWIGDNMSRRRQPKRTKRMNECEKLRELQAQADELHGILEKIEAELKAAKALTARLESIRERHPLQCSHCADTEPGAECEGCGNHWGGGATQLALTNPYQTQEGAE